MNLHLDCSTLEGFDVVTTNNANHPVISDGSSIYAGNPTFTASDDSFDVTLKKMLTITGDFDVTANMTLPDFYDWDLNKGGAAYLDFYINLDGDLHSATSNNSDCFDFYAYDNDDGSMTLEESGFGITIGSMTYPWTGDFRIVRSGTTVTSYINDTMIWTGTDDRNTIPNITSLEWYWTVEGSNGVTPFPINPPQFKLNDVSVTGTVGLSSNATLKRLNLSIEKPGFSIAPYFSSGTKAYTYNAGYFNTATKFTVENSNGAATILINGTEVQSGIESGAFDLSVGDNTFNIVITAENGITTDTYTVVVNRSATPFTDCTFSFFNYDSDQSVAGGGKMTPEYYTAEISNYKVRLLDNHNSFTINMRPTNAYASIAVSGDFIKSSTYYTFQNLNLGSNIRTVTITAEDGISQNVVTLDIYRGPLQIWTAADLNAVRNALGETYVQKADIDLSSYANWVPIGDDFIAFYGKYNGNNFKVTSLSITSSAKNGVGLFGMASAAEIINVDVTGVITGVTHSYVGMLLGSATSTAAKAYKGSTLINCHSHGSVTAGGSASFIGGLVGNMIVEELRGCSSDAIVSFTGLSYMGGDNTGGLIGSTQTSIMAGSGRTITDCHAAGNVTGSGHVGGLFGASTDGDILSCYATGNVSGSATCGGLIGYLEAWHYPVSLKSSYSTGSVSVSATVDTYTGGLIGSLNTGATPNITTIENCYATGVLNKAGAARDYGPVGSGGAGFIGYIPMGSGKIATISKCYSAMTITAKSTYTDCGFIPHGTTIDGLSITDCYFNSTLSGCTDALATAKTTAEMKIQGTFINWDFDTVWEAIADSYPGLRAYVAILPTGLNICIEVSNAAKDCTDAWVKISGNAKKITDVWTKINGVLKKISQ